MGDGADKAAGSRKLWLAAIVALVVVILVINPVGFIGGGMDDWQYLNAARCWVEQGPCLPRDHWQGRWPVVAPIALAIELFGESRWTIGLPSLAASVGCLALCASIGNRLFGRPVGYLAALLLLLVPAFATGLLTPAVEPTELLFLLAGLAATLKAGDDKGPTWAAVAGLAFGMAFQVRETSIAALPVAVVLAWQVQRPDRRLVSYVAAGAGFLAPLIVEMLTFWSVTGEPLWRRNLSVAHTRIASSELLGSIDRSRPPFFNPDYIANWRHEPGLHLHWTVDGLLNLMVNPKSGVTQWLAPLTLIVFGKLSAPRRRRICWAMLASSLIYAALLTYALALDPNPRLMLLPLALCGLTLAALIPPLWSSGRQAFAAVAIAVPLMTTLLIVAIHHQTRGAERTAERWVKGIGQGVATDETTRRHLALVPVVRGTSAVEGKGQRRYLMLKVGTTCRRWLEMTKLDREGVMAIGQEPLGLTAALSDGAFGSLCLFRSEKGIAMRRVRLAIAHANMEEGR